MSNFKVIVDIRVVNSEDEPVNYKGYPKMGDRPHTPISAKITVAETVTVETALAQLNAVYKTVDSVKEVINNALHGE